MLTYNDFYNACEAGDIDTVNRALENETIRANAAAESNHGLFMAAHNGHLPVVNRLLEIETVVANIEAAGNWAFRMAAHNGHLPVVNRLLEVKGIKQNAAGNFNWALRFAARMGHLPVVNRLLEIKAVRENATECNNQALIRAVVRGHKDVPVRLLRIRSVFAFLKDQQQDFIARHQDFFNEVFKRIEEERYGRVWAVKTLSQIEPQPPFAVLNHILGLAYHDDLCGNVDHLKTAPSDIEDDGLISCPIINQFRRKTIGSLERVQANREVSNSISTNSTAEPETKRARVDRG